MTDWDAPFDAVEPKPGVTTRVSVFAACALVRLLCLPFDLFASLRDGRHPQDDAVGDETDSTGAIEMGNYLHNGMVE